MSETRLSGVEKRKKDRDKKLESAKKRAVKIAEEYFNFDELANIDNVQEEFEKRLSFYDELLKEKSVYKNHIIYAHSFNGAVKYIQEKIEEHGLQVTFPKYIVIENRPKSFRDNEWFQEAKSLRSFYKAWMQEFEYRQQLSIYDVFLSLVFHSAVLQPHILKHVLKLIINRTLRIQKIYNLPFVNVVFNDPDTGYSTNIRRGSDQSGYTSQNIFISPITAVLLSSYEAKDDELLRAVGKRKERLSLNDFYQKMIGIFDGSGLSHMLPKSLKRFLTASVYVIEHHENYNLPEYFCYLMLGVKKSYSLPLDNWQVMIYQCTNESDKNVLDLPENHFKASTAKNLEHNKDLAQKIYQLFKPKGKKYKLSEEDFDDSLEHLLLEYSSKNAPLSEVALLKWFKYKRNSCQPNSIQTYSGRITNRWLALTYDVDINEFDEADFEYLYAELLSLVRGEEARKDTASTLDNFHAFLVDTYGCDPVEPMSSGSVAHVKSGYISEHMFQAILHECDSLKLNIDLKTSISISLILAYRCGMRIGEIAKLQLKEISTTLDYLEVRNNAYGSNKTSSALRSLPISLMLLKDEIRAITALYHRRMADKGQTLIADSSGESIPKNKLSQIISGLIKDVTGLSYLTAHNLRHSCLTNLQLISFFKDFDSPYGLVVEDELNHLLPYSREQLRKIETNLFGDRASISNYVISGVAGHVEPTVGFNNYIHLTDIQIGIQLWSLDFELSNKQKQHLLKIPRRKLNLSLSEMNKYVFDKLKTTSLAKPKGNKKIVTSEGSKKREYSFNEVSMILRSYQSHDDFQQLLRLYDVPVHVFKSWLKRAVLLRDSEEFQTKFRGSRLLSPNNKEALVPTFQLSDKDIKIIDTMDSCFNKLYVKQKQQLQLDWFVEYTLKNCIYGRSYIQLNDFESFERYLNCLTKLLPKRLVHLEVQNLIDNSNKREAKKWQNRLRKLPTDNVIINENNTNITHSNYTRSIRAKIYVASSDNNQYSRILQYYCFYRFVLQN